MNAPEVLWRLFLGTLASLAELLHYGEEFYWGAGPKFSMSHCIEIC
jgi:hypothetical protein